MSARAAVLRRLVRGWRICCKVDLAHGQQGDVGGQLEASSPRGALHRAALVPHNMSALSPRVSDPREHREEVTVSYTF